MNLEIHPDCYPDAVTLRRADDINEVGSIVGVGDFTVGSETRPEAFILTPTSLEPCPEDVDKDGDVDIDDLDIVTSFVYSCIGAGRPPCPPPQWPVEPAPGQRPSTQPHQEGPLALHFTALHSHEAPPHRQLRLLHLQPRPAHRRAGSLHRRSRRPQ